CRLARVDSQTDTARAPAKSRQSPIGNRQSAQHSAPTPQQSPIRNRKPPIPPIGTRPSSQSAIPRMAKKPSSLDRVLGRLDTLDSVNLANLVQRLARERTLFEEIFNTLQEGILVI